MSIFNRDTDLPALKADRLLNVAAQFFPDGLPSDDEIWFKLLAEEVSLEQRLRTFFEPRLIYSTGSPPPDLDTQIAAGVPTVVEPGYDFTPDFFSADVWGLLSLRNTPVIEVQEISFTYPNPAASLYTVPLEWIHVDFKVGRVNLVPTTTGAVEFPASAFILSALSGGRTIPFMIKVRYRAGIENIMSTRPDIVDAIRRMTVLSILDDQFIPTSGSSSIDGLSQSLSIDIGKFRDMTDARIDRIASSVQGIRVMVL